MNPWMKIPHTIRYSELNRHGVLSMSGLLRLLQDAGYAFSHKLCLDLEYTRETGCTFFLVAWDVELMAPPTVGEEITILVGLQEAEQSLAWLGFLLEDRQGQVLASGQALWVYVEEATATPQIQPPELWQNAPRTTHRWKRKSRLVPEEQGVTVVPFSAQSSLIDVHDHANNVELCQLALQLTDTVHDATAMQVEFRRQVLEGMLLCPTLHKEGNTSHITLRDDTGEVKLVAKIITKSGGEA